MSGKIQGRLSIYDAPKDGTPVWLVFSDAMGEWKSLSLHHWSGGRWRAVDSGMPVTSLLAIVGWLPAGPKTRKGTAPSHASG